MDAGPELLTLEQLGTYSAMQKRGEISENAIGLLQATRLSLVQRGLFVYGNGVNNADYGGGARTDAARQRDSCPRCAPIYMMYPSAQAGRPSGWPRKICCRAILSRGKALKTQF